MNDSPPEMKPNVLFCFSFVLSHISVGMAANNGEHPVTKKWWYLPEKDRQDTPLPHNKAYSPRTSVIVSCNPTQSALTYSVYTDLAQPSLHKGFISKLSVLAIMHRTNDTFFLWLYPRSHLAVILGIVGQNYSWFVAFRVVDCYDSKIWFWTFPAVCRAKG